MMSSIPAWAQSPELCKLPVKSKNWKEFLDLGTTTHIDSLGQLIHQHLPTPNPSHDHPASTPTAAFILTQLAQKVQGYLDTVSDHPAAYGLGFSPGNPPSGEHHKSSLVTLIKLLDGLLVSLVPDLTSDPQPVLGSIPLSPRLDPNLGPRDFQDTFIKAKINYHDLLSEEILGGKIMDSMSAPPLEPPVAQPNGGNQSLNDDSCRNWLHQMLGQMVTYHGSQALKHGYLEDICKLGQSLLQISKGGSALPKEAPIVLFAAGTYVTLHFVWCHLAGMRAACRSKDVSFGSCAQVIFGHSLFKYESLTTFKLSQLIWLSLVDILAQLESGITSPVLNLSKYDCLTSYPLENVDHWVWPELCNVLGPAGGNAIDPSLLSPTALRMPLPAPQASHDQQEPFEPMQEDPPIPEGEDEVVPMEISSTPGTPPAPTLAPPAPSTPSTRRAKRARTADSPQAPRKVKKSSWPRSQRTAKFKQEKKPVVLQQSQPEYIIVQGDSDIDTLLLDSDEEDQLLVFGSQKRDLPPLADKYDWPKKLAVSLFQKLLKVALAAEQPGNVSVQFICGRLTQAELENRFAKLHLVILPTNSGPSSWVHEGNIVMDLVDPDKEFEVHDLGHWSKKAGQQQNVSCMGRAEDIMAHINDLDYGRSVNWLDLPDSSGVMGKPREVRLLASSFLAYNSTLDHVGTWADPCLEATSWLMATAAGAITLDHVDSDGLATWVHIEHGAKIWLVCCGPINSMPDIFAENPWVPDPWDNHLNDFDYLATHYAWQAVYLPAGSTLIMQPHTMHVVVTVAPTLANGGHFYSGLHLNRTLHGLRLNNYHGGKFTNATHPETMSLIHRMILYVHERYLHFDQAPKPEAMPFSIDNLAILIILTGWEKGQGMLLREEEGQCQHYKAQRAAKELMEWEPIHEPLAKLKERLRGWMDYKSEHPIEFSSDSE